MAAINECPKCGSRNITKGRKFGCAFVIFLFVSMGLGLLMIPFLPVECKCKDCKLTWKP